MKKLLLFILVFLSFTANAQLQQLGGGGGGLDGGSGGGGGGGGGAASIAPWGPATAYALDDITTYNNTIYIRVIAGTTATAPDQDITNWAPLSSNSAPSWDAATYYHVGQLVEDGSYFYSRLIAGISAGAPSADAVNWQPMQIDLNAVVTGILPQANGGIGFDGTTALDGQLLIGDTGTGFVSATITGTLNQVAVANGAGSITLSTPQDIHSGASPTFVSATFSGVLPSEFIKTDGASGLTSVASIDLTSDVSTSVLPIANGGTNSSTTLNDDRIMLSSSGSIIEGPALADGELLIGQSGGAPISGSVTGTLNQVAVVNGAGSITLSTPQDIHSGASPTFVSATFSGALPSEYLKTDAASGLTTVASIPLSDLTGILPQAQGGTGSDFTSMANGEIFIGDGTGFVSATVTGTLNQVAVTNGAGSITLSTPQDIHSGASPTFVSATFSGLLPNEPIRTDGVSGLTTGPTDLASEISGILPVDNGGTGLDNSAAANGTFLIGNGTGFDLNVVSGTANQVIATPSAGGLTLSTPQDIHVGATPTFVSATFSGLLPSEFVKTDGASGLTTAATIDFADLTGIVPQDQGGTGIDASTLANGEIFIGNGAGFVSATVSPTLNQTTITNGAGSITVGTVQDIDVTSSPTFAGLSVSGSTPGSVLFYGAGGALAEDNANFFYDNATDRLGVGTLAPAARIEAFGTTDIVQMKVRANNTQSDNIFEVTASNGNTEHLIVDEVGNIGVNIDNPLTNFHVVGGSQFDLGAADYFYIDGATNPRTVTSGAIRQDHTAGVNGTTAHFINVDSAGFDDTHGIRVTQDLVGETAVIMPSSLLLSAEVEGMSNVMLKYIDVQKTGTEGANNMITALHVTNGIDPIMQHSAGAEDSDTSFTDDGGFVDVSANFNTIGSDTQIFSNDNAYIYLSHVSTFEEISVLLSIVANNNINGIFEYSQGGASWNTLSVTDGTNGFQQSGSITFMAPTDWAVDTVNAVANKYWVRIQRTRNGLPTPPTESRFQVFPAINYGWDKDGDITARNITTTEGVVFPSLTTAERDALTPVTGQHVYNTTVNQPQYYNGTGWISY